MNEEMIREVLNSAKLSKAMFPWPNLIKERGIEWVSKRQGQLTDYEMARAEVRSIETISARNHEAECESAAMALLKERS